MSWSPSPTLLSLPSGEVHVFRLRLELPDDQLVGFAAWLDQDERARAERFFFDGDRRRFIAAHGQVRQILADYLSVRPVEPIFERGPHGKPSLVGNQPLRFNLSHSGELGLLGVCAGQEIGIDLEQEQRKVEIEALARRFFAPGEVGRLLSLPSDQQRAAFFNCWTRKEAYIKGRGQGLAIALHSFEVSLAPGEPPLLFEHPPEQIPSQDWRLYNIPPGPGYAGALAVEGSPVTVRCWDWAI